MNINLNTDVPKLEAKGDFLGIVKLFQTVRSQVPLNETADHKAITMNIAMAYQKAGAYKMAELSYQEVLEFGDDPMARYMLSIVQLHNGKVVEGFSNYGYRWASPEMQPYYVALRTQNVPYLERWGDISGKRLFVTGEQGLGDELMFSRAVVQASKTAQSIVKLSPELLVSFFIGNAGSVNFSQKKLSEMPPGFIADQYDIIVTVGDLFGLYVQEFNALPPVPTYVAHDPVYTPGKKPKVGFVYSPGNMGDSHKERTINPKMFKPYLGDYSFYSFQIGAPCELGEDMSRHIVNFDDTADLLDGMDCAVTCDTAFAHLALNMGKPTLLVYDKYLDWRFKIGLYPKVQLLSTTDRDFPKKFRNFVEAA